ncbi:hypothetical protein AB4Y32_06100 [Paraburkholderia phymatum]|uniref:Uncharacterized protein n=1 Tax=Paraburkholderia phymatum TaxID=148447 RepID=A0ACC6TVM7_9BURK
MLIDPLNEASIFNLCKAAWQAAPDCVGGLAHPVSRVGYRESRIA